MTHSAEKKRWGIIGGGILGMALAHRLAQHGESVTLFDGAEQLGGLASAWDLSGIVWDRHYHVTLLSDTTLRALLQELDLERELKWTETRTGFYCDGRLYSMSNLWEYLKFPPLRLWDKFRLGATILYASRIRDWKKLENILVTDWLRRWSGERTFQKIWLPLLRAKLGENYRKASAAFIWAIIARLYAARRTGLKKEMFGYVPGGYARILARFAEVMDAQGVQVKLKSTATRIASRTAGGVEVDFENGHQELFDQVIVTAPAPVAARLCPQLSADEQSKLQKIEYQGIVCASLLLKKPLAGFYVTNITDSWVPFTAVIEMSALVDRQHFAGYSLVYLPKYVVPNDPVFAQSDAEVEKSFINALERMYGGFTRRDVAAFRVSRVRHVLAISTLDYSKHLPPVTTSVPGVHIANSAHIINGTLNVNETLLLAERIWRQILSQHSPTRFAVDIEGHERNKTISQPVA
jgi:protoporphyrinogen oxidase